MYISLCIGCPKKPADVHAYQKVAVVPPGADSVSQIPNDDSSSSADPDSSLAVKASEQCVIFCRNGCGRKANRRKRSKIQNACCDTCFFAKGKGQDGHDMACDVRNLNGDSCPWYWKIDNAFGGCASRDEKRMNALLRLSVGDATITKCAHVQDVNLWNPYADRRSALRQKGCERSRWLKADLMSHIGHQLKSTLDKQVNETFLFHGTHLEAAQAIARHGFKLPSRPSNFGKGLYFSDLASKCIKYSAACKDGDRAMLLCRVILGNTKSVQGPHDAWKCRDVPDDPDVHSIVAFTSAREFIVYDPAQVYPEYLIRYRSS